ncbi:MAG: hypothetical protein A4E73_00507 [Syntrophaceae bacterium PtaU1.Bin231]|nr:MAG: hypothetical protein A4E73_00507 [Syntrophaceae bacterium PtaU1.Bin231]
MNVSENEIRPKALEALKSCLRRVPFLKLESIKQEPRVSETQLDFLAKVSIAQKKQIIAVEVKGNGQPRIARAAANQIIRYREKNPAMYYVFAAPYISPQSAEICTKEGIGYFDLAGNCRLTFDRIFIEQEGKPNPFTIKRDLRSLYSPKAERVLRVLLNNPKKAWRTQSLAMEAEVSLGQVANVKSLLENREWVVSTEAGLMLSAPDQLLSEWSENYKISRNSKSYFTLKDPAEIEADLAKVCKKQSIAYALTSFSAAARYAPAVRYQRAMAYVGGKTETVAELLALKEVSSGANVTLLAPYDDGVLYGSRSIDGIQVAIPVQVYLDLMNIKGRGEEAATILLEEIIKKSW